MRNLLVADLKRVLKDKLFLVICIIGACFAIFTPLLNLVLIKILGSIELEELVEIGFDFSGKMMFFSSFSLTNNFGLILPIFIIIIILKDFSHGTIRNKIICGHSRTNIFLSMFITTFITIFGCMLAEALLSLGFTLIFAPYQHVAGSINDLWYFMESIVFLAFAFAFISALISCLCILTKSTGLTVVGYIAITMSLSVVGTILQVAIALIINTDNNTIVSILSFIDNINIFTSVSTIGQGTTYSLKEALYYIIPSIVGTGLFSVLGIRKFNKKDI